MMEFEADRMTGLILKDENVLPERDVVLEEYNMRVANNPEARLNEQIMAALYLNHPYGRPVIGWHQEIEKLDREDALAFYRRFYAPNNAILVIAGDVEVKDVRAMVEETFGKVQPQPAIPARRIRPQEPEPVAPPGTKFSYSSYGFNLVSAVVESAAGEEFLSYMQGHVFTPLGLAHTAADQNTQIVEQRSRFYGLAKDGHAENAPYVDNSYKWAGGGFLSTAEDLVRFGSSVMEPGFLKAETLKTMFTPQKTKTGEATEYGIGWFIHKSQSGKLVYEHAGGSVGGTSQLILYPETHVVVALVTNLSDRRWKREEVESVAENFASTGK